MSSEPDKMSDLSPQQLQELANRLLQQRKKTAPPTTRVTTGTQVPLSYAQEALWLVERLGTDAKAYNEAVALQLTGQLHVEALQDSLAAVVSRHDALRASIVVGEDGIARQVIESSPQLALELMDVPELRGRQLQVELQRLVERPFDLAVAPLFRATLLKLSATEYILLWVVHHIVWDGWSANIFVGELCAHYAARSRNLPAPALPSSPMQYADFATWQRGTLTRESLEQQRDYWRRHLAGAPALLELPGDHERPAKRTYRGAIHRFEVPALVSVSLEALSRAAGATLYMTLLALYQVVLAKLSGTNDIVVRSPTSGRAHPQIGGVIGLFVNLLAMRAVVQGGKSFTAHLERVKQRTLEAFSNQDFPYEWLVADQVRRRDLSHEPIAQADFVLRDAQAASGSLPGLTIRPLEALHAGAINDLTLIVQPSPGGLRCELVYATDLFEAHTVSEFAARFVQLAQSVAESPERNIDDIDLRLPMPANGHERSYALTAAQQIRWQQIRDVRSTSFYDIQVNVELAGAVDAQLLAQAVDIIVEQTSSLRLSFKRAGGDRVLQRIQPSGRSAVALISAVEKSTELGPRDEDVLAAPALQCLLLKLDHDRFRFCGQFHPLTLDESDAIEVMRRCLATYAALASDKDVQPVSDEAQVQAYLHAESESRYAPQPSAHRHYWRGALANSSAVSLAMRNGMNDFVESVRHAAGLPPELTRNLKERAAVLGCSVAELMFAATDLYLHKVTGVPVIRVGTRVSVTASHTESYLVASQAVVPVAIAIDPSADFNACLQRGTQRRLQAAEHARCYADAEAELFNGEPAFRVTIEVISGAPVERDAAFERNLAIRVYLSEDGGPSHVAFDANPQLFMPWEQQSLMAAYISCLQSVLTLKEGEPVGRVALISESERLRLLEQWCVQQMTDSPATLIHESFEKHARLTPDAIAVVYEQQQLTYAQLNARANRLAHLLQSRGVGPDVLVALYLTRSPEMVTAVLAVLKAGGAYVPLDPTHPPERLTYILEDSAPRLLVTERALLTALPWNEEALICLDDPQLDSAQYAQSDPNVSRTAEIGRQLAYVIYTSGSTGAPKGVMVEHRNVVQLFAATQSLFGFSARDVWTLFHSYGFDFSVWELWGALSYGGRLVVVPPPVTRSPDAFYELICAQGVTVLNQTPSAFRQLIQAQARSEREHALRHVIFGGEALDVAMLTPWYARNPEDRTRLVNMYGITETTVHVTYCSLRASDTQAAAAGSPIGTSLPHLAVYILDAQLQPVPVGVIGEIYVGGEGVARGYLNRSELTQRRFLDNPFVAEPGARLYRSGDLGRWRADGSIEYLGRNDQQVKIRGFRIELGEIEVRLLQHSAIAEAIVTLQEHEGDKRLVAYVITTDAALVSVEQLRSHLERHLPEYMVPAFVVQLAAWPLTANGKLDRSSLPKPDSAAHAGGGYEPPQGEIEPQLAKIWRELLNVEHVGRGHNFFDLGGHSLLAIQVLARVRAEMGVQLAFEALFECRDLQALAQRVEMVRWSQQSASLSGAEVANQRERLVL